MDKYVFLCFLLSALAFIYKKSEEVSIGVKVTLYMVVFSSLAIIASLMGWRAISQTQGGIDTIVYKHIYEYLITPDYASVFSQRLEIGYALLFWISKNYLGNFEIFLFILSFLLLYLYLKVCSYAPNSVFSLLSSFLIALFVIDSFNISRMILSIFILFFILPCLQKRYYISAVAITLLASSIQMTGLWGLVIIAYFYCMYELFESKFSRFILFISGLFASYFMVYVFKALLFNVGYTHYLDQEGDASYLNYFYLVMLISLSLIFNIQQSLEGTIAEIALKILPTMFYIVPLYSAIPIAYRFNLFYILIFFFLIPFFCREGLKRILKNEIYAVPCILVPFMYFILKVSSYFDKSVYSALSWEILNSWYIF